MVTVGKPVKNFSLPATGNKNLSLEDFKGKHLVLYFYPKDNTPGCTREGQDFRDAYAAIYQPPMPTSWACPKTASKPTRTSAPSSLSLST